MSRCGCSNADGCACFLSGGDCLSFSGAGTEGDPYLVEPILSAEPDNQLTCEADGLYARGVGFEQSQRTAGNLTINSVAWADVDNGLDLVLAAVSGDLIAVSISGAWGSEAVDGYLDAIATASGTHLSGNGGAGGTGILGWQGLSGVDGRFGPTYFYQAVVGDLAGGNITLRLRTRTSTATNKTLGGAMPTPLTFFGVNHGIPR